MAFMGSLRKTKVYCYEQAGVSGAWHRSKHIHVVNYTCVTAPKHWTVCLIREAKISWGCHKMARLGCPGP